VAKQSVMMEQMLMTFHPKDASKKYIQETLPEKEWFTIIADINTS
jgi:hypothetical protein